MKAVDKSFLIISNSIFNKNSAGSGNGGVLYVLSSDSSENKLNLTITNSTFTSNSAKYGSVFYFDSSLTLDVCEINKSNFSQNVASSSAVIATSFESGILTFNDCEFTYNIGRNGAVLYADHNQYNATLSSQVEFNNCQFSHNSALAVLYLADTDVKSLVKTNSCIISDNYGAAILMINDEWVDVNSIIERNTADSGGALEMFSTALADCTNTTFGYNSATIHGGAISAGSLSRFKCDLCTFIGNNAVKSGGAMFIEQNAYFEITNSNLTLNSCGIKGSVVYLLGSNSPVSSFTSCNLNENSATSEASIALLDSAVTITTSNFFSNTAKNITPGLLLTLSNATITDSKFYDHHGYQGGFIYATTQSELHISGSIFETGETTSQAGAIFAMSSKLTISNSTFENLESEAGGAIVIYSGSNLTMDTSIIKNSKSKDGSGGAILAFESYIEISDSVFDDYSESAISADKMNKFSLYRTTFSNGSGKNGGAISCTKCLQFFVEDCEFSYNNASSIGGAIYLYTTTDIFTSPYVIKTSKFISNSAGKGGGIYTNNIHLNVTDCVFIGNDATFSTSTSVSNSIPTYGNGGGLNLACTDMSDCSFFLLRNKFTKNFASYNGGAINWEDKMPNELNNVYEENTANYGNNIASFAIGLKAVDNDGNFVDDNRILTDVAINLTSLSSLASGQPTTQVLTLALVDFYNNIVATDSSSQAELLTDENDDETAISGTNKVIAKNGIYNFTAFIITAMPGKTIIIQVSASGIDKDKVGNAGADVIATPTVTIPVSLRECVIGEASVGDTCEICPANTYSLDPANKQCLSCPSTAVCNGE